MIVGQIDTGNNFVAGAVNTAVNGGLIAVDAYTQAIITDAQQDAYNNAISSFVDHSFYDAQKHLQDLADSAQEALSQSVDDYVVATVALQTVATINAMASSVTNTVEAEAMQDYAVSSGAADGITDGMQNNYNNSLAAVNKNAQEFATYSKAAIDPQMIDQMNDFSDTYGASMDTAYTSLDLVNGYITTDFYGVNGATHSMSHSLYFIQPYSTEDVYADGESIYQ